MKQLATLLLLTILGCTGSISDLPEDPTVKPEDGPYEEAECGSLATRPTGLRLLRKTELLNVLKGAFSDMAPDDLPLLEDDPIIGQVLAEENNPQVNHGRTIMNIAVDLAQRIDENPSQVDPCLSSPDTACLDNVFDKWAFPILRHELSTDERRMLHEIYEADGLGSVAAYIVLHPETVFLLELGGEETDEVIAPDADESAAYVAFALTEAPPTREFAAAFNNDPAAAIELIEPRMRNQLHALLTYYIGERAFAHVNGPETFLNGIETDGLDEDIAQELYDFLDYVLDSDDNQLREMLSSTTAFPPTDTVANIMGLDAAAPQGVSTDRVGLLSHPALLAEGSEKTSPIHRGLFVLRQILCIDLDPLDPQEFESILEQGREAFEQTDPKTQTIRERLDAVTAAPQCAHCHNTINPIGYAFEAFDAMGRAVDTERVFDPVSGEQIAEHDIDTNTTIGLQLEGLRGTGPDEVSIAGPEALANFIANNPRSELCFARRATEFTSKQVLSESEDDRCLAQPVTDYLRLPNASIRQALAIATLTHIQRNMVLPTETMETQP